jgi:acetate kinase
MGMHVLVINCGSSSLRADILDADGGERRVSLRVERIGEAGGSLRLDAGPTEPVRAGDHGTVLAQALPRMLERLGSQRLAAVGHRVVHGGERFSTPTRIDDGVEQAIEALADLAPLHNPINLAGIRAARRLLPDSLHVAVFDTGFHATLPRRAQRYALPVELAQKHGIRRYGFHGTSHSWVVTRAAEYLGEDPRRLRVISCHLGSGCSVAAVEYGRCIETSMGLTPLEGLVMGTRSGDLDPGILPELMRREGLDADALDRLLNRESGLRGLSGLSGDMRDIEERAAAGDERCRLAIRVFYHRLRKYIGAYAAVLGGVEAIAFSAGIGQNSALVRQHATQRLEFLGARLDPELNRAARVDRARPVAEISPPQGRVRLLVVATDEAHAVARAVAELVRDADRVAQDPGLPIAISARHVHLTQQAVEALFGPGHRLAPAQALSQPGQFAARETLTLRGPKRCLEKVRVVGPVRRRCQVEISRSDEFHLGLDAPVRASGDLDQTPGITLVGPSGSLTLHEGVICAQRHIHMTPADAARFGVRHRDVVEVAIDSQGRDLVFGDVLVRVASDYALELHLDTDEGNAAEVRPGDRGVLAPTGRTARLTRRQPRLDARAPGA